MLPAIELPSPLWGRGWTASGAVTSRGGPGEGVGTSELNALTTLIDESSKSVPKFGPFVMSPVWTLNSDKLSCARVRPATLSTMKHHSLVMLFGPPREFQGDRKSTRLNSSHLGIS